MATEDPREQIQALLNLITTSANAAMSLYEKSSLGIPSPSLLEPFKQDGTLDALGLKKSLRVLEGACEALCTTLAPPMHTLTNRMMSFETPCLRIAVTYKIADVLLVSPNGLHVDEIAKATGLANKKLSHVLRLLATRNCFREVSQDVFANNRLSLTLTSSDPFSSLLGTFGDECNRGVSALHDAIHDPVWGPAETELKTSFMYAVQNEIPEGTFFEYEKAHPDKFQRFSRGMIAWSELTGSTVITTNFPWDRYKTFCDFGSGMGHMSLALIANQTHLKVTLQDLPPAIEAAKKLWQQKCPKVVENGQVEFVAFDFFKEHPVAGLDIYYLKHIVHNWPDLNCVEILTKIAQVMPKHGRVLIHEFVTPSPTPDAFRLDIGLEKAPEPLLPNYGTGQVRVYSQDVSMMSMFNALERNVDEFKLLGQKSGLSLIKVWDYGETVMLEYELAL